MGIASTFRGDILRTTGRPAGSICEQVLGVVLLLKVGGGKIRLLTKIRVAVKVVGIFKVE